MNSSRELDGNLVLDGRLVYTWDAENRLIGVAPAASPVNGDKKLEFQYDYMSRRVEKKVYTYSSGWGSPTEVLRFVYDQWNVILVLDGLDNNATLKKYTWGLDLSGQRDTPRSEGIHGAGGIGGLLAVEETTGTHAGSYWFLYDANGNVGQVVKKASNYPLAAHYEYDAYGNVLGTPTGYAAANPFRFSTKWFDGEIGQYYYGYRYYSPRFGRWLNRDPIEEIGARWTLSSVSSPTDPLLGMRARELNDYAYALNRPPYVIDLRGAACFTIPPLFGCSSVADAGGTATQFCAGLCGPPCLLLGKWWIWLPGWNVGIAQWTCKCTATFSMFGTCWSCSWVPTGLWLNRCNC